jgi:pilus assembly protein TadC
MFAAASIAAVSLWWGIYRRRSLQLIDASIEVAEVLQAPAGTWVSGRLTRWLNLAGYRGKAALLNFFAAMAASIVLASATAFVVRQSGIVNLMAESLRFIPGGVGDLASAIVSMTNWIVFVSVAAVPILVVRAKRRKRVEDVEQDLPLFLELLATLAEAGLGFEAGLARVRDSMRGQRPLQVEFQIYQRDLLAGTSRLEALRKVVRRMEVNSVTVFVSALIQAEQIGSSLAETLRRQADDLRDRRKMRALLQSQALTVKLVFPLVLCFLPGIFVTTLGPVINQMIKVADSVLRNAR